MQRINAEKLDDPPRQGKYEGEYERGRASAVMVH